MNDLRAFFVFSRITMRRAAEGDIDGLVSLINDAYSYQDELMGESRTGALHLRGRMAETDFYALQDAQRLVGCVYLDPVDDVLHFGLLTLEPHYRGKGIAEAVMRAIEEYGKSNLFDAIELDYMSVAPWLKPYYERYGFAETGEQEQWGAIDLIRMRKLLSK